MTQKQILALAADDELMSLLEEIYDIQHKTVYEQKSSEQQMKHIAKIIIESLK